MKVQLGVAVALLAALVGAACGSGAPAPQSSTSGQPVHINVGIGGPDPIFSPLFIADQKGWFKQQNLDVNIALTGVETIPNFIADQVDIAVYSLNAAQTIASRGIGVSVIYGAGGAAASAFVGGRRGINSITDCKTFSTYQKGSAVYAYANMDRALYKANYTIAPLTQLTVIGSQIATGQVDCGNSTYVALSPFLASGQIKLLADPEAKIGLPSGWVNALGSVVMGKPDYLKAHRSAIVRFLKAYTQAENFMLDRANVDQIANMLTRSPIFAASTPASLQLAVQHTVFNMAPCGAYVSEATWPDQLAYLAQSGQDISGTQYSYAKMVDMSFYDAAVDGQSFPGNKQQYAQRRTCKT